MSFTFIPHQTQRRLYIHMRQLQRQESLMQSADIVGGQSYVARVKAVASAADEADSELSDLSKSAVAASSIKSISIVEPFDTN